MEFHLNFQPKSFEKKIVLEDQIFLAGSCFTEQIGQKLSFHQFRTTQNPHGIIFNPFSIATALEEYLIPKTYTREDLFYEQELFGSWNHHTRFSAPNAEDSLTMINEALQEAHHKLLSANWLLLTLGSAFVYQLENGQMVANCHKVPADRFEKRLTSSAEIIERLNLLIGKLKDFNPSLEIIFTISPVRHLRDGFVENNRSKATLITSVHQLCAQWAHIHYFPAYELIIDDLRDYRFYAEDMVHPNYAATQYVWEKFVQATMDKPTQQALAELAALMQARNHKAFNPQANAHRRFLQQQLTEALRLQEKYPYLQLHEAIQHFTSGLAH